MIKTEYILEAKKTIEGVISHTPFTYAPILSELCDASIYLKKENLQLTGAYKIRGAYNKINSLSDSEKEQGVIAASAGNHAQGVAYSARTFGIQATIIMPESTPLLKVQGTRALGAEVILHGNHYDDAYAYAKEYAISHKMSFIHPFEDDKVIEGQATVGVEILEKNPDIDMIIVPIGGGGLISGIGSYVKQNYPHIQVVGVTASGAPAMHDSFYAKKPLSSEGVKTIADGIAVRDANPKNLDIILDVVDTIVSVDDEEIASGILFLLERQKLVVEGAGATAVAALLHNKIDVKNKKVAVVLSGGNIDVQMLSVIIEKGLIKSYRKMKLIITLIDKPGALMDLTLRLKELSANIIQIDYDRVSTTLDYGDANVTLALETKGKEHQEMIQTALKDKGYSFTITL